MELTLSILRKAPLKVSKRFTYTALAEKIVPTVIPTIYRRIIL